jgi:hypothetical protein
MFVYKGVKVQKITVNKDELLAKLEENRNDHRRIFEEALEGFAQQAERELSARIDDLRNGIRRDIVIRKPVPTDHTADYNRAIAMIKMSLGDTITLEEHDFAQYVMDDWGWQGQFLSNTYGSSTAQGKFSNVYTVS